MRIVRTARNALVLAAGLTIVSCTSDTSDTPGTIQLKPTIQHASLGSRPDVVISQIYGGGGNSGATLTNDFIELHNASGSTVSLAGWSVQYASAAGTTWQVTALTGSIPAGGYWLVQESKGAGGTTTLVADDSGTIAMSATAGKVALASSTTALTGGACPTTAVDLVSFGTTATDCGAKTTAAMSNTTAASRGDAGCAYTGDNSADFAVAAPAPRNSATAVSICAGQVPVGALDHVTVSGPNTVIPGSTIQLIATPQDINNQTVSTATVTWQSSDPTIATVDNSGKVLGVAASASAVTITATAVDNAITRTGTIQITVNTPGINWIDVSSSSTSFPPGFQTQLFVTARVASGGTIIPADFTFEALDPTVATITDVQNTGLVTGVGPQSDASTRPGFRITATPVGGGTPYVFVTHPITIENPAPAPISIYATNDEFGDPTPATTTNPNDLLITRPEYTISYNESRGTPNWVSYELDARQMVAGQDRCNCFTAEPQLPTDKQIVTSDYTNGGFDRGHMARSADRTAGNVDNAFTFMLSNVVPQQADLNQGVWAQFENALADSAEAGRAVYIIVGPLFSASHGLTFIRNEGKIAIPDSTWKVALIGPRNGANPFTRGTIQSWDDLAGLTLLAVNMPNIAGVRNDPWQKYLTTVDKIEASTGYDFLSLLQISYQNALEAGDRPPVAAFAETVTANEDAPVTLDASASTDPDLGRTDLGRAEALSYSWTFSDGGNASGKVVTHTFKDNAGATATLTVTDAFGWPKSITQNVVVNNVAPTVTLSAAPTTVVSGTQVFALGRFTDPGPDSPWQALFNWGNGTTSSQTLLTQGSSFNASARLFDVGSHNITLSVTDKDGGVGSRTVTVNVVRQPVLGVGAPALMSFAHPAAGDITVTLYSDALVDVTTLDLSSVRVGSVGKTVPVTATVKGHASIALHFSKQALVSAGAVTNRTDLLQVVGTTGSGVQLVAAPILLVR
ncbi:MAG TPA: DNA/RNA non-specific endonuclease [Gemmatimonadales bacterium]|jgi:DNA/RNA endonuclease G (NUC1)